MEIIGRKDYIIFTDDIQDPSPLLALSDKLAAERDRWPAGPVPWWPASPARCSPPVRACWS